jgi:hypothetical protein
MNDGLLIRNIFHRVWIKKSRVSTLFFYNSNAVIF